MINRHITDSEQRGEAGWPRMSANGLDKVVQAQVFNLISVPPCHPSMGFLHHVNSCRSHAHPVQSRRHPAASLEAAIPAIHGVLLRTFHIPFRCFPSSNTAILCLEHILLRGI